MKKLLLLIFFFIFFLKSQAQTSVYHPFPEDTAFWITDEHSSMCSGGYCFSRYYEMYGDTLINGQSYNKIYVRGGSFYTGIFSSCGYTGAIRQDSINKKVYFIDSTMTTDTLLYDFNLTAGDTIHHWYNRGGTPFPLIVSGIDSVSVNGIYHKRFMFYPQGPNLSLIEGVGWTGDLLFGISLSGDGVIVLTCFNGQGIAGGVIPNECSFPLACNFSTGISKEPEQEHFSLFPNPASGKITISNYSFSGKEARVEIYNMMGELVSRESVAGSTPNSQLTTEINVSSLAAGVYLVQIRDKEKIWRGKMIKE